MIVRKHQQNYQTNLNFEDYTSHAQYTSVKYTVRVERTVTTWKLSLYNNYVHQ